MRKGLLLLSALLLFPQAAWSQYFFPRVVEATEWGATGYAVVNPNDTNVEVRFYMFTTDGIPLVSSLQVIPPGGQFARLGAELFPNLSTSGWVQIRSNAPVDAFWVGGDFSTFADGGGPAPVSAEQILPLAAGQTGIHIANAGTGPNTVTIRLRDEAGAELAAPATRIIPYSGGLKVLASALFPSVNMAQARTIRITSAARFSATSVVRGFLAPTESASLNGVDAASTVLRLNFPHIVAGPLGPLNYTTVLGATNLSIGAQNVTLTFHPEPTGAPVSVTRSLPAGGSVRDSAQALFSLPAAFQDGWVDITGTAPITGFAAYAETTSGGLAVVPVQETPQSRMVFAHIAGAPFWYSGAALLNTGTQDANVEIFAMTPGGGLIGGAGNLPSAAFTLRAGHKTARLLSDVIPPAAAQNGGFVFVRTTNNVPLFGMELFGSPNGRILANVPGIGVPNGINYEPPPAVAPAAPPTIAIQPYNANAFNGETATFAVTANGGAPLTYTWQKNGIPIGGATGASYTTPPISAGDNGAVYTVTVSNALGSVTSVAAILATANRTGFLPFIGAHPVPYLSASVGNSPVLSVTATGVVPTYQWLRSGVPIAGATAATYTLPTINFFDDQVTYSVLVCVSGGNCRVSANTNLQVVGPTVSPVTQVSAGGQHSLALRLNGTAWGWGAAANGRIGLARPITYPVQPLPVGVVDYGDVLFPKISGIAAATTHSLFLRSDGTVWATGTNTYGELGTSTNDEHYAPAMVLTSIGAPLADVRAIGIGLGNSYAVTADGSAWAWGNNIYRQLGDGTQTSRNAPTRVLDINGSPFKNAVAVAGGGIHTLWLKDDGTVWAVGSNSGGQLGDGTNIDRANPLRVELSAGVPLTGITAIAAGANFSLALRSDGKVFSWGAGRGMRPTELAGTGVPSVAASIGGGGGTLGLGATVMLLPTAIMVIGGDNARGILGLGHTNTIDGYVTVLGPDLAPFMNVQSFSLSIGHIVARKSDSSVWSWGDNSSRQTGSSATTVASPFRVPGLAP